jgi:CarboxypepD_reg-like domain
MESLHRHHLICINDRRMKENLNLYLLKAYNASAHVTQNKLWLAISLLSFLFILITEAASAQQTNVDKKNTKTEQLLVTGIVRDSDEPQPLAGVSVMIKGTQTGVLTDEEGKFSLRVDVPKYDLLVFTFIGKKTTEISIKEKGNTIDLTLYTDPTVFTDELVVTGEATGEVYTEKQSGLNRFFAKVKGIF